MLAIDLPQARRLALGVVLAQAGVAVAAAMLALGFADRHAAVSALLGGGIATLGGLVMAAIALGGKTGASPQRALTRFLIGELVKVAVIIAMFVVVLKTMNVAALPMLGAFGATFVVYWVALLARLPTASGARRGT